MQLIDAQAQRDLAGTSQYASREAGNETLPQRVDAYERMLIAESLAANEGNVAAIEDSLGVPKKTLYDKLKKY